MATAFLDTNILLYLASEEQPKANRVEDLVAEGGWISVQVLNETARVMRDKWQREWGVVHDFRRRCELAFEIASIDLETHHLGLDIAERYKIGIFDSMIVAAALQSGCDTLYSEDMHHGLVIEGRLTVTNPFRA